MGVGGSKVGGMAALRDKNQKWDAENVEYRGIKWKSKGEGEGDQERMDGTGRSGTERREYQGPGNMASRNTRATKR